MLSRIFTEVTCMPGESIPYGMQRFTVLAASFLLTAVMYIPLALVSGRSGESFTDILAKRNRPLAVVIAVPFSAYLLLAASETGLRSHYYTSSTLFDAAPSFYLFIFTGAALIFAAYKGLETVSRTGLIVCGLFLLLLLLITVALMHEIKTDRLYPAFTDDRSGFMTDVMREFSHGSEALIFAALCKRVRGDARKTIPLYLLTSLAAIMFMTFLYNTVFGRYLTMLDFPFYTLSSVSDISIIHRINGADVMIWIMASVIKLALYALAFGETVMSCFGSEKAARISACIFAAASVGLSWLFTSNNEFMQLPALLRSTGAPLVLAAVIAPSLALVIRPASEHAKNNGKV